MVTDEGAGVRISEIGKPGRVGAVTERAERVLAFYIYALPFHSLTLTVLLTAGTPIFLLKALSAWKELLLIALFLSVVVDVFGRQIPPRLCWVDALASLWFIQIVAYCLLGRMFDPGSTFASQLFAGRDWALYLLPYFIGRFTTLTELGSKRVLRALVWIGLVTSAVGIAEYVFVPTAWHVALGVPRYFSELLGLNYPDYLGGLPDNYWAEIVGLPVRRAVSVYLSGQGFAIPFLLIWPAVVVAHMRRMFRHSRWLMAVCAAALLLTITRMTITVCFVETLVLLLLFRRFKALAKIGIAVAVIIAGLLVTSESFRGFMVDTLTFTDTSASARPGQWREGFRDLGEHPFGNGLTAVGQVSSQLRGPGIGQEAGYLKVLNGLGLPGTLLYFGWFLGIALKSRNMLEKLPAHQAALCKICLTATIGCLLNNLAAPPDQSPIFMYTFCWLAGFMVQRSVEYEYGSESATLLSPYPVQWPENAQ